MRRQRLASTRVAIAGRFPNVLILPTDASASLIQNVHEGVASSKENGSTVFRNEPEDELL